MKQVLQDVKQRKLNLVEVPPPALLPTGLRVRTIASLISAGTEKGMIELGGKSLVGKAQARPDLVKQVVTKARKEGILNTFHAVQSKMERPMPLGYSAAGIVEAVGSAASGFKVGDRVAIAGAGYANHAEINFVPANLVATIPDNVSFGEACYTTVASIALQGVRICRPQLGEYVAVIGLGLIGLITVQLLKANGCRVIGVDPDPRKLDSAKSLGIDDVSSGGDDVFDAVSRFTEGRLVDSTIITAATSSNGPVETAGRITRRKGSVVVVGAVGMEIPRDAYYKKELELRISMSYGPGRYDSVYEEGGVDYPYDYVRWTEQRNMEAVLGLMSSGKLDVASLTTHRIRFEKALDAYAMIQSNSEPFVGVVLEYDAEKEHPEELRLVPSIGRIETAGLQIGFIGAGNYAALHLLPRLAHEQDVRLVGLVTATGLNAQQKASKFGFDYCTTEIQSVLDDADINAVCIATRHSTHAEYAIRALNAGKHVFVEKPVVALEEDLDRLVDAYLEANRTARVAFMAGLNRRFAPLVRKLKGSLPSGPVQMIYRVNSGHIPTSSWLHEVNEGGGMLVGEMCHFVDVMQFVAGAAPVDVYASSVAAHNSEIEDTDNLSVVVRFQNGSVGTLCYSTIGAKTAPKERFEVFGAGMAAFLDDFRSLEIFDERGRKRSKSMNQDKGQEEQIRQTVKSFRELGDAPIPFREIIDGMRVVFGARRSAIEGYKIDLYNRVSGTDNRNNDSDRIVA